MRNEDTPAGFHGGRENTAMCHPRGRGDPDFARGQAPVNRSAPTNLDARVRGHDKLGNYAGGNNFAAAALSALLAPRSAGRAIVTR
jgi:hypothetical protein